MDTLGFRTDTTWKCSYVPENWTIIQIKGCKVVPQTQGTPQAPQMKADFKADLNYFKCDSIIHVTAGDGS